MNNKYPAPLSKFAALIMALTLAACSTTALVKFTPEEKDYMEKAKAFPTTFSISKGELKDAWGRAQTWINKYSTIKLQTVTDYVIETELPGKYSGVAFGYFVSRTDVGDSVQVEVKCESNNPFTGPDAGNNAHLLAYYMKTAQLPPSRNIVAGAPYY